jgi:hypothetical protein
LESRLQAGVRYASDLGSVERSLLFGQFRRLKPGLKPSNDAISSVGFSIMGIAA